MALYQFKLASLLKELTAHVEPFFPIPPVNTITELRYVTITAITKVNSPIKYRSSKYSKNGICKENKQYKTKSKKLKKGNSKLQERLCKSKTMQVATHKLAL